MSKSTIQQLDRSLFRKFPPQIKAELAESAIIRSFKSDATIYSVGDASDGLYGVLDGCVRLTGTDLDGKLFIYGIMRPGWWFGETSTLDGDIRAQYAIAAEDCRITMIPRPVLMKVLEREPKLYRFFVEIMCKRLRRAGEVVEEAAFLNTNLRLANALMRIHKDRKKYPVKLTQEDLAANLGVTRQSIYRTIKGWQKEKWVSVEYGNISILQPDRLRSLIDKTG